MAVDADDVRRTVGLLAADMVLDPLKLLLDVLAAAEVVLEPEVPALTVREE